MKIKCKPVTFGNGHNDPNSSYNKFKSSIKKYYSNVKTNEKKVEVLIKLYLVKSRSDRSDIDNYAKPIVDALHEAKVFNRESQIYKLVMEKIDVYTPEDEGITIDVLEVT